MDIESRAFRAKAMPWGTVEIVDKRTEAARYVDRAALPSVNALAVMKESEFDRVMREAS